MVFYCIDDSASEGLNTRRCHDSVKEIKCSTYRQLTGDYNSETLYNRSSLKYIYIFIKPNLCYRPTGFSIVWLRDLQSNIHYFFKHIPVLRFRHWALFAFDKLSCRTSNITRRINLLLITYRVQLF